MGEYDTTELLEAGPIDPSQEEPLKQPYKLVDAFEWGVLDINNPEMLT